MPLRFAGIDLGKYAPGVDSEKRGKWVGHSIPGQKGLLQEDLGDGAWADTVQLALMTQAEYDEVIPELERNRRGDFETPRHGTRRAVLKRIKESILWTQRGEATLATLEFEDAALNQPDNARRGVVERGQAAVAQCKVAESKVQLLREKVYAVRALNLRARQTVLDAEKRVKGYTSEVRGYVGTLFELYSTLQLTFDTALGLAAQLAATPAGLTARLSGQVQTSVRNYQESVTRLRTLPRQYEEAAAAVRAAGRSPADSQPTIRSMELALYEATQADRAYRASQPLTISTEVRRAPGQSIYAFVQQHYAGRKTPAQMRALVRQILRMNPNLRNPALIPHGTFVERPAA